MKRFVALLAELERAQGPEAQTAAFANYLADATDGDRIWAIALLSGRRPKRAAMASQLRDWAIEAARIPPWLFDECRTISGDGGETVARLLPWPEQEQSPGLQTVMRDLAAATPDLPAGALRDFVARAWAAMGPDERLILNRLLTGSFRSELAQAPMVQAIAQILGASVGQIAQNLIAEWQPEDISFADLGKETGDWALPGPEPFAPLCALKGPVAELGAPAEWLVQKQGQGIRIQLCTNRHGWALWDEDGALISGQTPELAPLADFLPAGTVIEGSLLAWRDGAALPLADLARRLKHKPTKGLIAEIPLRVMADDLLQRDGADLRGAHLARRQAALDSLLAALPNGMPIGRAPLATGDWARLDASRDRASLRLRRADAARGAGCDWLWPPEPMTIAAVLTYVQMPRGTGKDAGATFSFGLWDGDALVQVARLGAEIPDALRDDLIRWAAKNTVEKFGPLRRVVPERVFMLGFDAAEISPRHRTGLALRGPRVLAELFETAAQNAGCLDMLRKMPASNGGCLPPSAQGDPMPAPEDI